MGNLLQVNGSGAYNPNLQVAIMHAWHVCSQDIWTVYHLLSGDLLFHILLGETYVKQSYFRQTAVKNALYFLILAVGFIFQCH